MKRPVDAGDQAHERARMLAAESIDTQLASADSEWLESHLDVCPDCAATAAEYQAIHLELRGLAAPQPPRDLWARTAAALDGIDGSAAKRRGERAPVSRPSRRPLLSTAIAVGVVVVVAVASVLVQSPIVNPGPGSVDGSNIAVAPNSFGQPSKGPQPPLAEVNGTTYWLASDAGVYEIKGGTTQCVATDGSCTVSEGTGQTLGSIASDSTVSAVIAPNGGQAAVWSADKIAILPLSATPQTVLLDTLTPRPTIAATPTATATPTEALATQSPTMAPDASATEGASLPAPTATPTATPAATPGPTAAGPTEPTAILSGYQIVGRDPEFSPDGKLVAFSAIPVDDSAGPDVFIWRFGDQQAEPVTSLHADLFAGWFGGQILISEISDDRASAGASASPSDSADIGGSTSFVSTSYVFDPDSRVRLKIDRPMLFPAVDPTGQYLVYWSGPVEFDPTSGFRQPGEGDLYFDSWSNLTFSTELLAPVVSPTASAMAFPMPLPTPTPSPTGAQAATEEPSAVTSPSLNPSGAIQTASPSTQPTLLPVAARPGTVHDWLVRWDAAGQHVAIWVADPGSDKIGRLSLFSIDQTTGLVDTNEPLLAADKVMSNVAFDSGHLVYTSAVDLKTYHQPVPAVPPSTIATPTPTIPGQLPTGATASESPAPQTSDRPGN
jgi:hypothetical protein